MCRVEGAPGRSDLEVVAGVTEEVAFEQGLVVIEKGEGILKAHHHSPHILVAVHLLGLLNVFAHFWI